MPPSFHHVPQMTNSFVVLYTPQKNKKKKAWRDGRLVLCGSSHATLYHVDDSGSENCGYVDNGNGPTGRQPIDAVYLTPAQLAALTAGENRQSAASLALETEMFLIQVEGPCKDSMSVVKTSHGNSSDNSWKRKIARSQATSERMKKLLSSKFCMPPRIVPLPPEEKKKRAWERNNDVTERRRPPLQPGELEQMYYGNNFGNKDAGVNRGCSDLRNNLCSEQSPQGQDVINRQDESHCDYKRQKSSNEDTNRFVSYQHDDLCMSSTFRDGLENNRSSYSDSTLHQNCNGRPNDASTNFRNQKNNSYDNSERDPYNDYPNRPQSNSSNDNNNTNDRPKRFQSNEYNPVAFYGEEDDDDDDEHDEHVFNQDRFHSHSRNHQNTQNHCESNSHSHQNDEVKNKRKESNNHDHESSFETLQKASCSEMYHGEKSNAELIISCNNSSISQNEMTLNQQKVKQVNSHQERPPSQTSPLEDAHLTDELLALFGATPASREQCSRHKNHSDNNITLCENNSFLESLKKADEAVETNGFLAGWNLSGVTIPVGGYDRDSPDDVCVNVRQDVNNVDVSNLTPKESKDSYENSNDFESCNTPKVSKRATIDAIVGLSLPSEGESSTESDDDTDTEE